MKVSIIVICWNDRDDILRCIESIYRETEGIRFEIIVTDNNSTDGAVGAIREQFPAVRILENGKNLGFGGGNNAAIGLAEGEYVLILNPDTIIRDGAIQRLVGYADSHPEAGAFGCRMLNADGSYQRSAYPEKTLRGQLIAALLLRFLGHFSRRWESEIYVDWNGSSDRTIGYQAGCCLLVRRQLLITLGGFDERLFHQCEDADLCARVWRAGYSVRFCSGVAITHVGGQNRGRYPIPVILETHRSRYRYFFKHHGPAAVVKFRRISLLSLVLRATGYGVLSICKRDPSMKRRVEMYRTLIRWHWGLDPLRFIACGEEPNVGYAPLSLTPDMRAFDHRASTTAKASPAFSV